MNEDKEISIKKRIAMIERFCLALKTHDWKGLRECFAYVWSKPDNIDADLFYDLFSEKGIFCTFMEGKVVYLVSELSEEEFKMSRQLEIIEPKKEFRECREFGAVDIINYSFKIDTAGKLGRVYFDIKFKYKDIKKEMRVKFEANIIQLNEIWLIYERPVFLSRIAKNFTDKIEKHLE